MDESIFLRGIRVEVRYLERRDAALSHWLRVALKLSPEEMLAELGMKYQS